MKFPFQSRSLSLQLPLFAALCSFAVGLALVLLAAASSRYLLEQQQAAHGTALAQQLATRISSDLETGDLLSMAAALQRFIESSPASQVTVIDIEGTALGQAGADVALPHRYRSPVRIGPDVAGTIVLTLDGSAARASRLRFILSLCALAAFLSLLVYVIARHGAQRLGNRLQALGNRVQLQGSANARADARADAGADAGENELLALEARIGALPMELLQTRLAGASRDEHYRASSIVYLHLESLAGYVSKLNERNLQRYTDRLHRIVYAAAGCYGGKLDVARQFGLIICFAADDQRGSVALRAISCAWLIREVAREVERGMSLSLSLGIAVQRSELGPGDEADIYPGLYLQSVIDELRDACAADCEHVLIAAGLAAEADVAEVAEVIPGAGDYLQLGAFTGAHGALLRRQRDQLLERLRKRRVAA